MLFNSFEFFVFLPIVIAAYYLLSHKKQNIMLLIASYFFYGWWDWRFLFLILLSTIVDYFAGIKIYETQDFSKKKKYVFISVLVNLTILGFFKYWNFFTESIVDLAASFGTDLDFPTLYIILPVGISFYTFQTMTYSIDIFRNETKPTYSFLDFALFVSFFPQLVAGPIERSKKLLPQIEGKRHYDKQQFIRGLHLIFWGIFKKVFVADNLGLIVDHFYNSAGETSGAGYIIGTLAFAFQVYGDFSGYSDIARGSAKLMGIELMINFNQPFLAVSPSDFWRRWHISLSTWLRDYLYIPLGGNRGGKVMVYRNLILTMVLGGLWHGAAWTYVVWGLYHGIILAGYKVIEDNFPKFFKPKYLFNRVIQIIIYFSLLNISFFFFRAQSMAQSQEIFYKVFSNPGSFSGVITYFYKVLFYAGIPLLLLAYDLFKERGYINHVAVKAFFNGSYIVQSVTYGFLFYLLFLYGAKAQSFIYFQF